jgi:hypothetical protein
MKWSRGVRIDMELLLLRQPLLMNLQSLVASINEDRQE